MSTKRKKARVDAAQARCRIHIRMSPGAIRRLRVACVMEGTAPGPYLERLIEQAAGRWVVQDRPGSVDRGPSPVDREDRSETDHGPR